MKYILAAVVFLSAIHRSFSLDFQTTRLTLDLKNLPDSASFYLVKNRLDDMGTDTLEVAKSINGSVVFKSQLPADGEMIFIIINNAEMGISGEIQSWITLFPDGPGIHIKGDAKEWPMLTIEGSKASEVYNDYYNRDGAIIKKINGLLQTMQKEKSRDSGEFKRMFAEYRDFAFNYFKKNINVQTTPFMVAVSYPLSLDDKKQLWAEMSNEVQASFYGKQLEKKLVELEHEVAARASVSFSNVSVGEPLPDFKMEAPDGTVVSIRELASRSEFTLIDFWAYWCGPCRDAVPELKRVFEKYRKEGFNVVGVSVDPNREKWQKALKELDTKWDNLLDVGKISKPLFSISAIPAYVLINKNAEIVAMTVIGNSKNGASDRYFLPTDKVSLRGSSMDEIVGKLMKKK